MIIFFGINQASITFTTNNYPYCRKTLNQKKQAGIFLLLNYYQSIAYFKLKITAVKSGSFFIDLTAIIHFFPSLFTGQNLDIASKILGIFSGIFNLKKVLKGEKPKKVVTSGTKAEVETAYGEVVHFPKEVVHYYFNNCKIDTLIVGMMDSVCEDKERSGITFIKDGKEELLIDSADFRNLRKPIVQDSIPTNRIDSTIVITDLLLRKPDLMGQSKWGFHLNKHIEATIADVGWLQQVHAGKIRNLYAGVKIPVKLQIDIELDETSMPIEGTEKYIVLEILGSIIEPEQQNYQLTMDNETFNKKQGD